MWVQSRKPGAGWLRAFLASDSDAMLRLSAIATRLAFMCTMFTKFTPVSTRFHYLLSFQQEEVGARLVCCTAHSHCASPRPRIGFLERSHNHGPRCGFVSSSVDQAREKILRSCVSDY